MLITAQVRAYMNHGRWVADCVRPHCHSAVLLQPRQMVFECGGQGGCRLVAGVEWPPDVDDLTTELARRPVPTTRNWFPPGHDLALKHGLAHGQTVQQLRDEFALHEAGGA